MLGGMMRRCRQTKEWLALDRSYLSERRHGVLLGYYQRYP
jgi:hypothetical protein